MALRTEGTEFLDVDAAAALLGVKKATLYAYVSRGVLRSYKQGIGRKRMYRRADIEELGALRPSDESVPDPDDGVLRNVHLPDVDTWAGDH